MRRIAAAILLGLILSPPPAFATDPLVGASTWNLSGKDVALRFTFPKAAARLLVAPGKPLPFTEEVARYVLKRVHVEEDHVNCPTVDQGYDLGHIDPLYVGPGLFGFDVFFECPRARGSLTLRNDALFDLAVPYIDMARVRMGHATVSRLVTAADRKILIPDGKPAASSGPGAYIRLGARHVLTSLVRICTLCGLLLCVRRRQEMAFLVLGIVSGYLIAAVAASHWIVKPAPAQAWEGCFLLITAALLMRLRTGELTKPAVGLAAVAAIAALVAALRGQADVAQMLAGAGLFGACLLAWAPWDHPSRWLAPAFALAAVDGFTLSSELAPLGSAVSIQTGSLLAFNIGAACAALALLVATAASRSFLERYATFLQTPVLADLLAASLAGLGAFFVLAV